MSSGEVLKEVDANYTQSEGRALGGTLYITEDEIRFEPRKLDELTGGDELRIPVEDIVGVGVEEKFGGGIRDTLSGGGLRDRLRIERKDGREELFVVSEVTELADEIRAVAEGDTSTIPDSKTRTEDEEEEEPELGSLLLKGIAYLLGGLALLLGVLYLLSSDVLPSVLLLLAGIIGTPYTRAKIRETVGVRINKWTATILYIILWLLASWQLA